MGVSRAYQVRLASFLEEHSAGHGTPGVALALTDREVTLCTALHGFANLDSRSPVTGDTLFEIGSISKSFTAIAILQMHELGRLDVHAPVSDALPWFEVPSAFSAITLHHLLCHTAGIINGSDFTTEAAYEVWALRQAQASAPPGARYHYSNVGYKALGLVLETVSGMPYGQVIQEMILRPLGMHSTRPVVTHQQRRSLAVGYGPLFDDRPYHPSQPLAPATWLEYGMGDGSIASTAADMAIYARMLLNRGEIPGGRLLTEKSFDLLSQRAAEQADEEPGMFYGYGLNVHAIGGHACLSHSGGMVGYQAYLLVDMDDGLGVAVLVNGPGKPEEIGRFALRLKQAERGGENLPSFAPRPPNEAEEHLADYVGEYHGEGRSFTVRLVDQQLTMGYGAAHVRLEVRRRGHFYVDHEDFGFFLLTFGRQNGRVVEAFHGPHWYTTDRYDGPTSFDTPPAWEAFVGHFRSHNPWLTNFRVVLRKGALTLILPEGNEEPLSPLGDGVFRVGRDPRSPERIRFETILEGHALKASLSGCDYYRTFTP